jgi:hypothetical protein
MINSLMIIKHALAFTVVSILIIVSYIYILPLYFEQFYRNNPILTRPTLTVLWNGFGMYYRERTGFSCEILEMCIDNPMGKIQDEIASLPVESINKNSEYYDYKEWLKAILNEHSRK